MSSSTANPSSRRLKKRFLPAVVSLSFLMIAVSALLLLRPYRQYPMLRPFLMHHAVITELSPLESDAGDIRRCSVDQPRGTALAWIFPDGAVFWCENVTDAFTLLLGTPGKTEELRLNPAQTTSPLLMQSKHGSLLIQPPLAREPGELDGTNYIAVNTENGTARTALGMVLIQSSGKTADWWAYCSPSRLDESGSLDWLYDCTVEKFGADNRMTTDGYYYSTPSNYIPSGEGYYYRIPAAYIASKLARFSHCTPGFQLATAMLDIQRQHYNADGYIPTVNASSWLLNDYEIADGFYDTRFNTYIGHALLDLGRAAGISEFTEHAMNYAAFLCAHAAQTADVTDNAGILVDDYAHHAGNLPTLTSLNHQLAETYFLFETRDSDAVQTAQRMLQGIVDTADLWIRPDGNLHYAVYPDGSYGGDDYPYLTYNDLLDLNTCVGGNDSLELLLETKKVWMDANGITGYNQPAN